MQWIFVPCSCCFWAPEKRLESRKHRHCSAFESSVQSWRLGWQGKSEGLAKRWDAGEQRLKMPEGPSVPGRVQSRNRMCQSRQQAGMREQPGSLGWSYLTVKPNKSVLSSHPCQQLLFVSLFMKAIMTAFR